ncbi:MAG: histidinol-phosphate transaminase [Peptococcaceae bacterium]|nr:histidinol-phosphate transaminase [Peptococcaceae bacterium]
MHTYWSKLARNLVPYVPGEQPQDKKYIKLNTNENPYPPSPKVIEAIKAAANDYLKLYPDPQGQELRAEIAEYYGLAQNKVFVGNGSDEILAFAFMAFFDPGRPILFPDITYSFYPVYAGLCNLDYETLRLNQDFSLPVKQFCRQNGGIIFPNPNAPTGKAITLKEIEEILSNNRENVVIIDEAYIDFGAESAVKLINQYPNLLVVQTLSKSRSLAGLRVGWALGEDNLIKALDTVKNSINSYTLDRLALAGAQQAIKDEEYFQKVRKKIITTREKTSRELLKLGFTVIPSQANFVFVSHPAVPAEHIFQRLKEQGVLVRYFKQPRIDNFLRVSIGTDQDMETFLQVIEAIVRQG